MVSYEATRHFQVEIIITKLYQKLFINLINFKLIDLHNMTQVPFMIVSIMLSFFISNLVTIKKSLYLSFNQISSIIWLIKRFDILKKIRKTFFEIVLKKLTVYRCICNEQYSNLIYDY
jgi:hypothetical protein